MKSKLIGIDLDGVIIDSIEVMKESWRYSCEQLRISVPFESYLEYVGIPFGTIMFELGLASYMPKIKSIYDAASNQFTGLLKVYPRAIEVINELNCHEFVAVSIITSKTRSRAVQVLEQIDLSHIHLISPEDVARGKPHPDPLLRANLIHGVRPNHSVYIGDMISDYHAAIAADWDFLFAEWGYGKIDTNSMKQVKVANTWENTKAFLLS